MFVQIETTTVCNAACVFCVHKDMKRERTHMQQSVFEKTIKDAARIYPLEGITLTGLGETLLDPEILNRINFAKAIVGDIPISIFTNGTNLEKYLDDLLASNVNITLSLNGVNSEKAKAVMGINVFNDGNLSRIVKKAKDKLTISVVVDWGLIEHGDREVFTEAFGKSVFMHFAGNWAGKLFDIKFKPTKVCCRPFSVLHVLVDGRVALCCFDADGEIILGDNLLDALRSKKLAYVKKMMEDGKRYELPLCGNCTTI